MRGARRGIEAAAFAARSANERHAPRPYSGLFRLCRVVPARLCAADRLVRPRRHRRPSGREPVLRDRRQGDPPEEAQGLMRRERAGFLPHAAEHHCPVDYAWLTMGVGSTKSAGKRQVSVLSVLDKSMERRRNSESGLMP